jgi:DNA helicase MCM8
MPRQVVDDDDEDVGSRNRGIREDDYMNDPDIPPYWHYYFPGEPYDLDRDDDNSQLNRKELVSRMMHHFKKNKQNYSLRIIGRETSLHIDLQIVAEDITNIMEVLTVYPTQTIACFALSAHRIWHGEVAASMINVRLFNFYLATPIRHLKASSVGRFVMIKGTVVRVSNIKPVVTQMKFVCNKCKAGQIRFFQDGKFIPPDKCINRSCKGRTFLPDRSSAVTVDWQKIRLQEIVENDSQHEAGRIPRTVEIEMTKDMVEAAVPGDQVSICGTVKMISTDQNSEKYSGGRGKSAKAMYFLYLDGNSLSNNKEVQKGYMDLTQFSLKDLKFIQDISQEKELFHLVVNSLCPTIFGHEIVKAGLCLGLFGGVQKYTNEKDKMAVRGDPHMLVVGDPGLGKSQLLTAVSHVAPRGVYVCGNTTSTSGLTVTVVRDPGSGDYSLEAGALVLADQGTCCIDEFDKMRQEHQALLEAMEQQSISIAKAGIVCTLPARCSVIAAANPAGGHYNRAKTVSENLKISPALLSRFDLIFILLDRPDKNRDKMLSDHVMNLHSGFEDEHHVPKRQDAMYTQFDNDRKAASTQSYRPGATQLDAGMNKRLREYLRPGKKFIPMPPRLLRKYIAYARKYVHPVLSDDAKQILQSYYLKLRQNHHSSDSTPITTRQLESLIRLAQARAKIELRESVTEQDALDVIEIMSESLYDVLTDETGQVDLTRNTGYSKLKGMKAFVAKMQDVSSITGKDIFSVDELRNYADSVNLGNQFEQVLDKANHIGYLLKQANRCYKFTATK